MNGEPQLVEFQPFGYLAEVLVFGYAGYCYAVHARSFSTCAIAAFPALVLLSRSSYRGDSVCWFCSSLAIAALASS